MNEVVCMYEGRGWNAWCVSVHVSLFMHVCLCVGVNILGMGGRSLIVTLTVTPTPAYNIDMECMLLGGWYTYIDVLCASMWLLVL